MLTDDWFDHLEWVDTPRGPTWVVVDRDHDITCVVRSPGGTFTIHSWIEMRDSGTDFTADVPERDVRAAANNPSRAAKILMGARRQWTIAPSGGRVRDEYTVLTSFDGYEPGGRGW